MCTITSTLYAGAKAAKQGLNCAIKSPSVDRPSGTRLRSEMHAAKRIAEVT